MRMHEVVLNPVLSEKTMRAEQERQYIFRVNSKANKHQVREAVQTIYGVSVEQVRVMIMPAKTRRRGNRVFIRQAKWKKAVVSVAEGDTINLYDSN